VPTAGLNKMTGQYPDLPRLVNGHDAKGTESVLSLQWIPTVPGVLQRFP
jgi:hypothetical protein